MCWLVNIWPHPDQDWRYFTHFNLMVGEFTLIQINIHAWCLSGIRIIYSFISTFCGFLVVGTISASSEWDE